MLRNFGPHPHSMQVTFYGTPYNTGDGLTMAQRVGAKLWHMNKTEVHSFACAPASKELGAGMVANCWGAFIGNAPGIIVNRDGKRFHNEYHFIGHSNQHREFDEFTDQHLPADDYEYSDYRNVPMYWIFDETTMKRGPLGRNDRWLATKNIYRWSKDNSAELAKGWFTKADTIEELGKKIVCKDFFGRVVGMDAAGLAETINRYNQYCAAGKDGDFGRRPKSLLPLNTPPFYAMEICECQTNTQGGPEHNKYRQTLDVDGKPIPRLYSVGELGSIYGFLYSGGGNIPEAYSSGRVAARHAVALTPWA
jgi:3-oxosteroid 1-dehydrogenase